MNKSAVKKRKIDDEGSDSEWCTTFIVVRHNQGIFYLLCQAMKGYNIKCHNTTKYSCQFDKIVGQARVDKIEHLKKSIKNN